MVTKKTSTDKVKETAKKTAEKKAPAVKKTVTKTTNAETTLKKDNKKTDISKDLRATVEVIEAKSKAPIKKDKAPKNNYNPLEEVLSIKAKNDEKHNKAETKKEAKKIAKVAKKAIKTVKEDKKVEIKETKIPVSKVLDKRDEVKENVKKADAKKFIELKNDTQKKENRDMSMFGAFVDGYKKIFTYKGRSSRFEFWSFRLLNLIFATIAAILLFLLSSNFTPFTVGIIAITFILIQILVYLSLYIRRLHDTGHKLWKEFFGPMTYSLVINIVASVILDYIGYSNMNVATVVVYLIATISFLVNTYYVIKTLTFASFIEEERADNDYGVAIIPDAKKVSKIVCFISIYSILVFVLSVIISQIFMLPLLYQMFGMYF